MLLTSSFLFAAPEGSNVKVKSYVCQHKDLQARRGSGVLISVKRKEETKIYVLTSAHGIFPGKLTSGICHEVGNALRDGVAAELIRYNIGNDLALLEVTDPKKLGGSPIALEDIPAATIRKKKGMISGFPFDSNAKGLQENYDALVRTYTSNRLMLPFIQNNALEVEGHSEYGMSGGAFWTEDGEFNGVTSHQYVEGIRQAAQRPRVRTYDPTKRIEGDVLALIISNEVVVPWLQTAFGSKPESADLIPNLEEELQGRFKIQVNGLSFAAKIIGDGAGIGGEDPEDLKQDSVKYLEIPITMDLLNGSLISWPFRAGKSDLKMIKSMLLANKQVVLTGFRLNNRVYRFTDPMMALYYWNNGYAPELRVIGDLANADENHRKLHQETASALRIITELRASVTERSEEDFLLAALQGQLTRIQNFQEMQVADDFGDFIDPAVDSPNEKGWTALFNKPKLFSQAQELKSLLRSIRGTLKEM